MLLVASFLAYEHRQLPKYLILIPTYNKLIGTNRPGSEGTDGGNVGTDVISPRERASDDKSDEPPVLPSNPPQYGKIVAFEKYLE